MSEVSSIPTSVAFAELSPALYIGVPKGVLVDYLPDPSDGLHLAVQRSLDHRPLPELLATEPGLERVPWDKPHRIPDYVDSLTRWQSGLQKRLEGLKVMELYLDPAQGLATDELGARLALVDAASIYRELLGIVAKVEKWSDVELQSALRSQTAELISFNKLEAWSWWNQQAVNHTQRKIAFAEAALDA